MSRQDTNINPEEDFKTSLIPSYSGFGQIDDDIIDIDTEPALTKTSDDFRIVDKAPSAGIGEYWSKPAKTDNISEPTASSSMAQAPSQPMDNSNIPIMQSMPGYVQPIPVPMQYPVPQNMQYVNPATGYVVPVVPSMAPQYQMNPYYSGPIYTYGNIPPSSNYSSVVPSAGMSHADILDFDKKDIEEIERRSVKPKHVKGHSGFAQHASCLYDYEEDKDKPNDENETETNKENVPEVGKDTKDEKVFNSESETKIHEPKVYKRLARRIIPEEEIMQNAQMRKLFSQTPTTAQNNNIPNSPDDKMVFDSLQEESDMHDEGYISVSSFLRDNNQKSSDSIINSSSDIPEISEDSIPNLQSEQGQSQLGADITDKDDSSTLLDNSNTFDLKKVARVCSIPEGIDFKFLRKTADGSIVFFQDINGKVYSVPAKMVL